MSNLSKLNATLLAALFAAVFCEIGICQDTAEAVPDELLTVAEKSQYQSTCTSQDVVAFVDACAKKADHVSRYDFGKTVDDKPMVSAVVANPPYEIGKQKNGRAVCLVIGNIHSGECAGKEGILMLLRELTLNKNHPLLKNLIVIIAPNYNADGNDKMAKTNRRGQKGPVTGMGERANSMRLDLNRDFMKLESPEAQSLIKYFNLTQPEMFIDCHTTNGSVHRYALTYDVPHNPAAPESIRKFMRNRMMPHVTTQLEQKKINTFYYGNFNRDRTTWTTYSHLPRYSTEFYGLRGGLGVLSEAYSYISYEDRIKASKAFVGQCLHFVNDNHQEVIELVVNARNEFIEAAKKNPAAIKFSLSAKVVPFANEFEIKGYDGDEEKDYPVKFIGNYESTNLRSLPFAYVFSSKHENVVEKLLQHGIDCESVTQTPDEKIKGQQYTITHSQQSRRAFQKHRTMSVEVDIAAADIDIEASDIIVRTAQPLGRLAAYLLEPDSDDGLVTWNFFDDHVEKGKVFPVRRLHQKFDLQTRPLKKVADD
jgi:hypothetical protein